MDLGERKQKILSAIIESYIRTGEPVGSKMVVDLLDNAVSSATIRNEMAELCSMGYLVQPHTSAGRLPTAPAFRLYVDKLMKRHALNEQSKREIDQMFKSNCNDPEHLIEEASEALAQSTGFAAVTTTPCEQSACIIRLEVMRVTPRTAALLIMTSSGALRSRVCRFDTEISAEVIAKLSASLSQSFVGKPFHSIGIAQVQSQLVSLGEIGFMCAPVLTAFMELVQETSEAEVMLSGQLNLLQHPDYELERARSLLSFLTSRELLTNMLNAHSGGLRVVLGNEMMRPELDGSSIILTNYAPESNLGGRIGIIGPLRMDYAAAIPRLEYFAKVIGHILSDMMQD